MSRSEVPASARLGYVPPDSSQGAESLCDSSAEGNLGSTDISPQWLIGKRVKIWWPGNLAFFEADVQGDICNTLSLSR
jgi:hypothetical protein